VKTEYDKMYLTSNIIESDIESNAEGINKSIVVLSSSDMDRIIGNNSIYSSSSDEIDRLIKLITCHVNA
jgi:hypothetical protein